VVPFRGNWVGPFPGNRVVPFSGNQGGPITGNPARLEGESDLALVAKATELTSKTSGFFDLGDLRTREPRFEVRLELGAGVVLSIARG
jgi:hypothetical protein